MKMQKLAPLALALMVACTVTGPAPQPRMSAPWGGARLPEANASVVVSEWRRSENRATCAPMSFATLSAGEGAIPRRANFSGGWAAAWDRNGLPGKDASGNPCTSCGRSAFGIAGTGSSGSTDRYRWPNAEMYRDGSRASWGLEGGSGPAWLASVEVAGQGCVYNVWSNVSESHLRQLISAMRFVEVKGEQ